MIATLIKQALRCFKSAFKAHNSTQSSHNALRGAEIGLRLWCIKRSHAVRFFRYLYCVWCCICIVCNAICIKCGRATQCHTMARLKPRNAGWATLCYTSLATLRSYMK